MSPPAYSGRNEGRSDERTTPNVAPLYAARTAQRAVPTTLNTYWRKRCALVQACNPLTV